MSVIYELTFEQRELYSLCIGEDELAYNPNDKVLYNELYRSFNDAKARLKSIISNMNLDVHTFRGTVKDNYILVNNYNAKDWYNYKNKLNNASEDAYRTYYHTVIKERNLL